MSSTRSTRSSTGRTRTTAAKPATAAGAAKTTRAAAPGSTKTDRTTDEKTGEKAASAARKAGSAPRKAPAEPPGRARARTRPRTRTGGSTTPGKADKAGKAGKAAVAAAGRVRRRPGAPPVTLTGRGGVVVISAATLVGALAGQLFEVGTLPGLAFIAGCVAAALLTRSADVLSLAVCPPVVFFAVALITEFFDAMSGESVLRSALLGVVGLLAAQAPWLFLGTALVIGITVPRGLLTSASELRTRLAGARRLSDIYDEDPVRWNEPPSSRPHGDTPDRQDS